MNINAECIKKACKMLKLEFKTLDDDGNLIQILKDGKYHYFHSNHTPLNNQMISRLSVDKEFQYRILKDVIKMPKTFGYLDPFVAEEYSVYRKYFNFEEIAEDIEKNLDYTFVLKRNRGSHGNNVFFVENKDDSIEKLKEIFNKASQNYDYLAIAQEKVNSKREFRIVVFNREIKFFYEKSTKKARFSDNLSPLHWEGSKAILIQDSDLKNKLENFIEPIYENFDLGYGGLDIIIDEDNQFWLIEINSSPSFWYFVRDNGEEEVVSLYREILHNL